MTINRCKACKAFYQHDHRCHQCHWRDWLASLTRWQRLKLAIVILSGREQAPLPHGDSDGRIKSKNRYEGKGSG